MLFRLTTVAVVAAISLAGIDQRAWADPVIPERTVPVTDTLRVTGGDLASPAPPPLDLARPTDLSRSCDGCCDGEGCCSCARMKKLYASAASAHKGLFYNNNFDYLYDPCWCDSLLGDCLKRRDCGCYGTWDVGGQYRARYHYEHNIRNAPGLGLTGRDDSFLLHRTRLYGNYEYGGFFRAYVEGIDADSNFEDFGPRPIEVNRADLLNLFFDFKLYDSCCSSLTARVGRQELLCGSQRTVSPLDWANTRRTFEGAKLIWEGTQWDIDAFWARPVVVNRTQFDSADQSQEFMGIYASYKNAPGRTADFYYLRYTESDGTPFQFDTLGTHWKGKQGGLLWEVEGAVQYGNFGAADHLAGAFTLGLGHEYSCHCWKPTLWVYYDWASGDETQGNGYHHLFPLAHKYLGFMDLYGRRNIEDLNFMLTAKPADEWKLILWMHLFWLQDGDDVPYNVVMGPEVPTAGGDQELGQEIDLVAIWNFHDRMNILFGYSHFFAGDFYATNTSPAPFDGDADFFYTQFTVNF